MMDKKTFFIAGILVAIAIAAMAPFLASSNPDGLESAFFGMYGAKEIHGAELDEDVAVVAEEAVVEKTGNTFTFEALMPDYTVPGLDKEGEILAIVLGTILVLFIGLGFSRILAKSK
ncbi:MAG: PDGLE domain-containing protein [Methanomicrobiales archaeon]|nr:PDGLE domain-containing protein [Methanomicrobiales archaeon]